MKKTIYTIIALVLISLTTACNSSNEKKAKYVFYFIGDGMGFTHVALAEAYKSLTEDGTQVGSKGLTFTSFPVLGMATTYSANMPITCSSAAGTALSTGFKTNNGMLGVAPDSSALESISYKFHKAGKKVGIMTSVTIDHATPGAFYAHSASRNDYYSIACELGKTGFEFFGGGSFYTPIPNGDSSKSAYILTENDGYTFAYGLDQFNEKKGTTDKIILMQREGRSGNLPYSFSRKDKELTLRQVVSAAVEFLDNKDGFFIMAEGGMIDWAAHANDAANTIFEVLDMDSAIEVAYEFYKKHPEETLIVVAADHETGGVTLGRGKGYTFDLSVIRDQAKKVHDLNVDNYMSDENLSVNEVSEAANIGWTTTSHTGGAIPVFSIGAGSEKFAGRMNNTDIPRRICEAAGVQF